VPENLRDFILASQISQAEADKFFIEMFRLEKAHRSGIIWWNLIDCWPQFSDAVVDYYFDEKLAYYYIRQVQKPLLLTFAEPADWKLTLKAVNDTGKTLPVKWRVADYTAGGRTVLEGESSVGEEASSLGSLPYSMGEKKIYTIEWSCGEFSGSNHYVAGNPPFSLGEYREFLRRAYPFYREH
jgi:beta-mannosidase